MNHSPDQCLDCGASAQHKTKLSLFFAVWCYVQAQTRAYLAELEETVMRLKEEVTSQKENTEQVSCKTKNLKSALL